MGLLFRRLRGADRRVRPGSPPFSGDGEGGCARCARPQKGRLMDDYPLLNIFLTMMWFFLWILWLMLLFRVIVDIFRDDALSGWAKAGWSIFVIVLPLLGVFVYLVARGKGMGR